ncbi:MAG TPA: serine/threonine-protein kinase [Chroococcales cyanobacterium]
MPLENQNQGQGEDQGDEQVDKLIGTVLADKYEIIGLIGKGGMSSVYKARHLATKKLIAVKVMHSFLLADSQAVRRFQKEATASSRLNHPHAISVHDLGVAGDGRPFLVMDYLEGRSLADMIAAEGKLEVWRCLHIFIQICEALSSAHGEGIIHRDLKPSNIMIVRAGDEVDFVKVVDFGIAQILPQEGGTEGSAEGLRLTATGEIFGSPLYMSPEQCQGLKLDPQSDIYSMGCLMYEGLTGAPPLEGRNMLETMYKQTNEMPETLTGIDADVRMVQRLDAVLQKAMAKRPADRFESMRALRKELESVAMTSRQGSKALAQVELNVAGSYRRLVNKLGKAHKIAFASIATVLICLAGVAIYCQLIFGPTAVAAVERSVPLQQVPEMGDMEQSDRIEKLLITREIATRYNSATDHFYVMKEMVAFRVQRGQWDFACLAARESLAELPEGISRNGLDFAEMMALYAYAEMRSGQYKPAYRHACISLKVYETIEGGRAPEYPGIVLLDSRLGLLAIYSAGYSAWKLGMVNQAKQLFTKYDGSYFLAVYHCSKLNWFETGYAHSSIGNFYVECAQQDSASARREADLRLALKEFEAAQQDWLKEKLRGELNSGVTFNQSGQVYQMLGNYSQAVKCFSQALKVLTRQAAPEHDLGIVTLNLSDAQWANHEYVESLQNRTRCKELLKSQQPAGTRS